MKLDERERQDYHEEPTTSADSGTTWIVIGFLFWCSDLIAFLAVGFYDIRVGHTFVLTWVVASALVGFVMILGGWMLKRRKRAEHRH